MSGEAQESELERLRMENQRLRTAVENACRAFGAPGDWGYDTREGKALFDLHRARAAMDHPA